MPQRDTIAAVRRPKLSNLDVLTIPVSAKGNWTFVQLKTDGGLVGWGEATHAMGFVRASAEDDARIAEAVRGFWPALDGLTPFDTELFRQRAWAQAKAGGLLSQTAFSACEQAMWDLAGQALDAPVSDLLGGALVDAVPVYANINRATTERSPEGFAANAQKAVAEGFRAIKSAVFDDFPTGPSTQGEREAKAELGVRRLEAMRAAVGSQIDLMVDCHSRFDIELAVRVAKELEPLGLRWYEEPVDPAETKATREIRERIEQPMAGGEMFIGREGFLPLLRQQAVDVIMPDVKHCGGLLEGKKIAALAEVYEVAVSPHNPSGPLSMAASAQLAATLPNCPILEHAWGEVPWRAELLDPPERFQDGKYVLAGLPGLGAKLVPSAAGR